MSQILRIGQSADPDDAFMAWGLRAELKRRGLDAELEFADIESLNRGTEDGRLDLSAISVGAYPTFADRYRLLRCGASFGDGYGPLVVGNRPPSAGTDGPLSGLTVAIPGALTTARMLLRIYAGTTYEEVEMRFDAILDAVVAGEVDAGLIIHEGQLVYERMGLHALFEPALEWAKREQLPLPLGVVAIRRDLAAAVQEAVADAFAHSVHAAFQHPEEALDFAASYARGLARDDLEEYVYRYVNAATLDMGVAGQRAIERLFERARAAGLLTAVPAVDLY